MDAKDSKVRDLGEGVKGIYTWTDPYTHSVLEARCLETEPEDGLRLANTNLIPLDGSSAAARELVRMATENAGLRQAAILDRLTIEEVGEIESELKGALAVLSEEELRPCLPPCPGHLGEKARSRIQAAREAWESLHAERDRLWALAGRMREALVDRLGEAEPISGDRRAPLPFWVAAAIELVDDADGQAAVEWLEAEKAKAAEPWKALAARMWRGVSRAWNLAVSAAHDCSLKAEILAATKDDALVSFDDPRQDLLAKAAAWLAGREEAIRREYREAANGVPAMIEAARAEGRAEGEQEMAVKGVAVGASAYQLGLRKGRRQGLSQAAEYCLSLRRPDRPEESRLLSMLDTDIRSLEEGA